MLAAFRCYRLVQPSRACAWINTARMADQLFQGPGSEVLRTQSCGGACSRETPKVEEQELPKLMTALPAWELSSTKGSIHRKFVAKNFMAAMAFFNAVAEVAESFGHHPDLHLTNYRDVEVVLSTHAIGALSMHDFVLAAKLDQLPVDYSPKWLRQQQERLAAAQTT